MKKFWFLACMVIGISACEKDDICEGGTSETPNVVINLYDGFDTEQLKVATKIAMIAQGFSDTIFYKNTNKIEVPLQINTNETQWSLLLYVPPTVSGNDTIIKQNDVRFNYETHEFYVSKACGYKVDFYNFNANLISNDSTGNSWIHNISNLTREITSDDHAHINLYY